MAQRYLRALATGLERLTGWADLLDRINVFPVADGDTGRNLLLTLTPLRTSTPYGEHIIQQLLLSARGNSGNIAAQFFSQFLPALRNSSLLEAARRGRDMAWKAVFDPQPGTILSVFDSLCESLKRHDAATSPAWTAAVIADLGRTVHETRNLLPKLRQAGVVDAGALGMFIFFDGFLTVQSQGQHPFAPIQELFSDELRLTHTWRADAEAGVCIDAVIKLKNGQLRNPPLDIGNAAITFRYQDYYKVHFHTLDAQQAKETLGSLGELVALSIDDLQTQTREFSSRKSNQKIGIMTDAAGSLHRELARTHDIMLLNSYIVIGETMAPETFVDAQKMYKAMRAGVRISTSQASVFERHQYYAMALSQYEHIIYLCVGSVYTGNFQVATDWKADNDHDNRFIVVDTGAASGRLGLIALASARQTIRASSVESLFGFCSRAQEVCKEYIFLDRLQFLAQGGRLSKTSAFFGDWLSMKPVISPLPQGAEKIAVLHNAEEQLAFALERLRKELPTNSSADIMIEFSDNENRVRETIYPEVSARYPAARIYVEPFSHTSGAHMGPGSWGIAYLPEINYPA